MLKRLALIIVIPAFLAACSENPEGLRDEVLVGAFVHEAATDTLTEFIEADVLTVEQAEVGVAASDAGLLLLETARTAAEEYETAGDLAEYRAALAALRELGMATGRIQAIIDLVED